MDKSHGFEHFLFYAEMLDYRINRLICIDSTNGNNKQEFQMVLDATFVLFRSMLLESPHQTNNYTFQNYFKKSGYPEYAIKLDDYLNRPFFPWHKDVQRNNYSIRNTIKFLTDKFICHVDKGYYKGYRIM